MNNTKESSGPNFLIVAIVLVMAIVLFGGNSQNVNNVEPKSAFINSNNETKIIGNSMQVNDADYNNLVMLVLAEAGGQPHDGKVAVAATVLNRYRENNYSSIYDVIFAPNQFSCCYNGYFCHADLVPLSFDNYPKEMIDDAMSAVDEALEGKDPTKEALGGGCLYYYNPDYTSDYELARRANITKTYRIGDHVFYREWD